MAFGVMLALEHTLRRMSQLEVNTVESGCGGKAGAFRYEAAMATGGLNLLPADRSAFIVPDRTSCRQQIADGPDPQTWHAADVLEQALP